MLGGCSMDKATKQHQDVEAFGSHTSNQDRRSEWEETRTSSSLAGVRAALFSAFLARLLQKFLAGAALELRAAPPSNPRLGLDEDAERAEWAEPDAAVSRRDSSPQIASDESKARLSIRCCPPSALRFSRETRHTNAASPRRQQSSEKRSRDTP